MGSLMSGWDSHPLDDQKGMVFWEASVKFSSARLCFCILGRCEVWCEREREREASLMGFVAAAGAPRFSVSAPNLF